MKTYSIWGESLEFPNTLTEGPDAPKFVNGTTHQDCPVRIKVFEASCWEAASLVYTAYLEDAVRKWEASRDLLSEIEQGIRKQNEII